MSADNRICLMEWQNGWYVWNGSCSMSYCEPASYAEFFLSKKEALDFANKEQGVEEGGITFIGMDEQRDALKEIIADAQARLNNLEKWNVQFPVNNDLNFR